MKLINIFKQALKEYKLSEDNVTNGWYVTSNGKLLSQIFDIEEEAKKHMDDVLETDPNLILAIKKLEKDHLQELSPLTRNLAAYSAASKADNEKTSNLEKTKRADQYRTFSELPSNIQSKGKVLAEEIKKFLFPDENATIPEYELKKGIPSDQIAKDAPPSIIFKIRVLDQNKQKQKLVEYVIYKDKFEESKDNPRLDRNLSSKLLTFIKELQKELQ